MGTLLFYRRATKALRGKATLLKSHSKQAAQPGWEPGIRALSPVPASSPQDHSRLTSLSRAGKEQRRTLSLIGNTSGTPLNPLRLQWLLPPLKSPPGFPGQPGRGLTGGQVSALLYLPNRAVQGEERCSVGRHPDQGRSTGQRAMSTTCKKRAQECQPQGEFKVIWSNPHLMFQLLSSPPPGVTQSVLAHIRQQGTHYLPRLQDLLLEGLAG